MRYTARFCLRSVLLAGVTFGPSILPAQGFGLNEVGTCAVARGFAVTGSPCNDASTIFWNPAAAAELSGRSISIGASDVAVSGAFRQDTTGRSYNSNISPTVVPSLFAAMRIGRGSIGIGAYVPYGLTSQWHDNFPGRFEALRASLQTIYVQPNVAYQVDDHWSVGGGPIIGHSSVELIQGVDLSQQTAAPGVTFGLLGIPAETEFARARFKGSANAVGYNVGVHGRFGDWSVGARYLSRLSFKYNDADVVFRQVATGLVLPVNNPVNADTPVPVDQLLAPQFADGGPLENQTGQSRIVHPWQLQGGVGYNGFDRTRLSVDIARLGWSDFGTLPIDFNGAGKANSRALIEDYNDSWSYRFGAEREFETWTGRLGYSYAESPAPDATVTPLLPDMNRRNFSAGIEVPFGNLYHLDVAYLHVNTPGRRGRIVERTSSSQSAAQLNTGAYSLKANVVSAALNITF
jgi:long-chain fatty acid transport protein